LAHTHTRPIFEAAYFSRIGFAVLLGAARISADLPFKTNARNLNLKLLPNCREILTILLHFSTPKPFTVNGLLKDGFLLT
jgi:hypothetical protein